MPDGIPWFTFGPFAAALIVAAIVGRAAVMDVFSRLVRWRVGVVWYIVAVGLPVAIQLATNLLLPLFGAAQPAWGNIPSVGDILPMVLLFAVFSGPLGEEPGWRGFALPRLLSTQSALAASLIVGLLWSAWHLPLFLVGDFSLPAALHVIASAVVFTWLYQNTNGSVLLPILMHIAHQNSVRFLGRVFEEQADRMMEQWVSFGLWAIVAIAVVVFAGAARLTRGAPPATVPDST